MSARRALALLLGLALAAAVLFLFRDLLARRLGPGSGAAGREVRVEEEFVDPAALGTVTMDEETAKALFPALRRGRKKIFDPEAWAVLSADYESDMEWPEAERGVVTVRTNNLGFREDEDTLREKAGPRILVLGDSHTEGMVDNAQSFANVLEDLLGGLGGAPVEVINAAVGGTGPHNFLRVLQKYAWLEPDTVIATLYSGNDPLNALTISDFFSKRVARPRDQDYQQPLTETSQRWLPVPQGFNQAYYFAFAPEDVPVATEATLEAFGAMSAFCAERGIRFLTLLLPSKPDVDPGGDPATVGILRGLDLSPTDFGINMRVARRVADGLRARGVTVVDPTAAMQATGTPLYWVQDHHLNVDGHALVAELLAAELAGTSWGRLAPGPYAVGFRSRVLLDDARSYRTAFDDGATYGGSQGAPRPILVNLWYPAQAVDAPPTMAYGRYLDLRPTDPALEPWARALSAYAADVACTELLDQPVDELDSRSAALWQRFLELPTRARPDARPAIDGAPFPAVIYHSGAGSSFEDNSVLCEFLASHGFVVLGSAYPGADGDGFGIDSGEGSVSDMAFLARAVPDMPFADGERLAYGGHSAGAQVCLAAQLSPGFPADVVFLLDTTIDYYTPAIPTFQYLTAPVLERPEAFTRPLLVAAGPEASFQMCDALSGADRTYLTIPELGHNEFIAQGVLRLRTQQWLRAERGGASAAEEEAARTRRARVERLYGELCEAVRAFLAAELGGRRLAFDTLCAGYATNPLGGPAPCVERAPRGETRAPPYDPAARRAPTPRQLRGVLERVGVDGLLAALEQHLEDRPSAPIYESSMLAGSLLYELATGDRLEDARALHAWLAPRDVNGVGTLRFLAFMSSLTGDTDRRRHYLEVARDIDPGDPSTLEELAELDAGG